MSKPRKSSAALAAREKARAKAEEITRRNEELIELAAGFFVCESQLAQIEEETERKIAELRSAAEQKKATAHADAVDVVAQMLATGESKKSIGERLGLSASELKGYLPVSSPAPATTSVSNAAKDTAADAESSADSTSK